MCYYIYMPTDPRTIQSYNEQAEVFAEHTTQPESSPLHEYYEKPAMRAELPQLDGLSVISLGCGNGADTRLIKDAGATSVIGVDVAEKLISIAHKNHSDIDFQVMDIEKLGFDSNSFDVAYSSLTLHYLDDWEDCLLEIRRVLRPGGMFIFSCYHPLETALEYFKNDTSRGALIGRTIMQSTGERTIHGDYMPAGTGGVRPIDMTVADNTVRAYHRTLSYMHEEITNSGFNVKKIIEPLPQTDMSIENPEHFKQVSQQPKFMIWVFTK